MATPTAGNFWRNNTTRTKLDRALGCLARNAVTSRENTHSVALRHRVSLF